MDHAGLTRPAMEVRRARSDELGACADLYVRVLSETFTWLPPERHRREDFLRAAREEETYLAVEYRAILGIAAFYRPQNFLHSLYVDARGQGVGKALLDHIAATIDGPISLKVQAPNLRAQAFYRREGFQCTEHGRDPGSDIAWLRLVRPPKS
ncbi:GNAT family N-acetyltransferase [Phenylobacterium sp.]|uniref:GNAT family N-acetyltransferase n=1 Tax=Phenylobacterium sp. TaxID=1871053 RepID=UPI0011FC586A|nr:GNAT family N-acetyltransferase [Phenylobacterium sp.]THD70939.1 MAG: N-acetyltransferase [Phenylobacterium sp.]